MSAALSQQIATANSNKSAVKSAKSLLATINGLSKYNQESLLHPTAAAAAKIFTIGNQQQQQEENSTANIRTSSPFNQPPTTQIKAEKKERFQPQQQQQQTNNVQALLQQQQQQQQQQGQFSQIISPSHSSRDGKSLLKHDLIDLCSIDCESWFQLYHRN